ncbi:MAG: hypothetical protein JJE36_03390 [Coriobacteriia bacterium]|nr:hypothetical protein [Coriobacteriia bacterium]
MNRPNRPGRVCCDVLRTGVDPELRMATRVVLRVRVEECEVEPDADLLRGCGLRESVEDIVLL